MKAGREDFRALSAAVLGRGSALRFAAPGCSMRPFIRSGDTIEVVASSASDLKTGDVAFYWNSRGMVVAHRLVAKHLTGGALSLQTRGDAYPIALETIDAQQVLGRVVAVERRGRKVRLDTPLCRLWSRLLVTLWPVVWYPYRAAEAVRRRVRSVVRRAPSCGRPGWLG